MDRPYHLMQGYHDAELVAVNVNREDQTADLLFMRVGGSRVTIVLTGVMDFRLVDFIKQNVVSRLMIENAAAHWPNDIRRYVTWARNPSDTDVVPEDRHLQDVIAMIRDGALSILILDS